jgi:putative transcriptional regulator
MTRALVVLVLLTAAVAHAESKTLVGQFLVASEEMKDPRFARTVVYMVEHDEKGALGVIVNRPLRQVGLSTLMRDLGRTQETVEGTLRVHYGGPVHPRQGFVLHTVEWKAADTRVVSGGVAFTTSTAVVDAIAQGTGPRRVLFALGYSGWAPRQLEAEVAAQAWITVTAGEELIFDDDAATKWDRAIARRKITL